MNNNLFTFIFIPIIIIALMTLSKYIRKKFAKPNDEKGVQKPGKFDTLLLTFITVLTVFSGLFTLLGAVLREVEMTIVFLVVTLVFTGIVWLLRREYDMTYQETTDYFILNVKKKEYKVFYENITDWKPDYKEISVLDGSRPGADYINVNVAMLKPEILLGKIAEMTFDGKFQRVHSNLLGEDPMRKQEIVTFLKNYGYDYLVEDSIEKER